MNYFKIWEPDWDSYIAIKNHHPGDLIRMQSFFVYFQLERLTFQH